MRCRCSADWGSTLCTSGDFHDDSDPHRCGAEAIAGAEGLLRGIGETERQGLPGDAGGRGERVSSADTTYHHESEADLLYALRSRGGNGQPFEENIAVLRNGVSPGLDGRRAAVPESRTKSILWVAHPRTKSSAMYPATCIRTRTTSRATGSSADRGSRCRWILSQEATVRGALLRHVNDDYEQLGAEAEVHAGRGRYLHEVRRATIRIPQFAVNYLKLDKVPLFNESWAPVVDGIRAGNFFGTTGEVLFHNWGIEGTGAQSVYTASDRVHLPAGVCGAGVERRGEGG
jgi:hypothetical protein